MFILCRSAERQAKEQAMHERFEQRIVEGLEKIAVSCQKRRQKPGIIERRVGRLLGRKSNWPFRGRLEGTGTHKLYPNVRNRGIQVYNPVAARSRKRKSWFTSLRKQERHVRDDVSWRIEFAGITRPGIDTGRWSPHL